MLIAASATAPDGAMRTLKRVCVLAAAAALSACSTLEAAGDKGAGGAQADVARVPQSAVVAAEPQRAHEPGSASGPRPERRRRGPHS
jgi:hypothetical protein